VYTQIREESLFLFVILGNLILWIFTYSRKYLFIAQ